MATFKVILSVFLIALVFENKGAEAHGDCQYDWVPFGDSCYWKSWSAEEYYLAKEDCEIFDSHMVVPRSGEENMFINELRSELGGEIWLGCDDVENEGEVICQDAQVTLSDRRVLRNDPDRQDCMAMTSDGSSTHVDCEKYLHYVCKKAK